MITIILTLALIPWILLGAYGCFKYFQDKKGEQFMADIIFPCVVLLLIAFILWSLNK